MSASPSEVTSPIANATGRCLSDFRHIITLLEANAQPVLGISSAAVQEELGRYQIWAGNLGAFQPIESGISLDYRLHRDGAHLSDHLVSRLTELQETLRESKSIEKSFIETYVVIKYTLSVHDSIWQTAKQAQHRGATKHAGARSGNACRDIGSS